VTTPGPQRFAEHWVASWNARDVEAVLAGCADDVVFTSPTAARVVPGSGGTVHGKESLRAYWTAALRGNPDLRFELVAVYAGVDTVAVQYRDQAGRQVCEVLTFTDGFVAVGHATHLRTASGS